ncbi:cell wall-binding repeat-containing protein [Peptacetobacter sp. AB800]|uniref:cell wall-binding repeat-containing protein n=1 Tax=Peptacetobacter sp. AB800 TaxID=3388428 RepID=UPI0039FD6A76
MHKKLMSIALGAILMLSTIAQVSALSDYRDDVVDAKYVNIGPYESYDNFEYFLKEDADATVLVSQRDIPDGLSASGLVGAANANLVPVYTSHGSSGVVRDYILTEDVYIVGGERVITKELENKLRREGHNVIRLAGRDRYQTSYRVAEEVARLTDVDTVAIVNGKNGEADAVSIASAAIKNKMPVIVTDGKKLNSDLNSVKTYAIGGNAVISDNLVNKTNAIRIGGRNRFETNKKVIKKFYPNCKKFMILESDGIHRSFALQAITADQPIVLVSEKSDKSVLNGADELLFVYFEELNSKIESSCLVAARKNV